MIEEVEDFWVYPLHWGDTLSNHDWVPLYINRLLTSRFVARALAQGRRADIGTAVILWCEAFRQDPAGTLPDDDLTLARLAGYGSDLDGWAEARAGALYGWSVVHVEGEAPPGDERRLGHRMIEKIALDMFKRKRGREQSRDAAALALARTRVKKKLVAMGNTRMAENGTVLTAITGWLSEHGLYITDDNVRAALEVAAGVPRVVQSK